MRSEPVPSLTASSLQETLCLNAGYISRSLALLTKRKLVRQTRSKQDGRERLLTLSPAGDSAVAWLNEQSALQINGLLADVNSNGPARPCLTRFRRFAPS